MNVRDAVALAVDEGRRAGPRIKTVSGRVAMLALWVAVGFTIVASLGLKKSAVQISAPPAPQASEDWRPPIKDCPDDVKLWDCIRHAMYREDI